MASKQLNFDTGIVDYVVNGGVHVQFNPADVAFTERFYNTFKQLESRQDEFEKRVNEINKGDKTELFAYARERDAEMRNDINELFQNDVADGIFDGFNCYAMADGMPVWVNFLFAIAEEVRDAYDEEQKKQDPRLKQFDAKHEELLKKYRAATTKSHD